MADNPRIEVGALNVVASPHPEGIYRKLLAAIAEKELLLWGSDVAKITKFVPLDDRPTFLGGRIMIWTPIDPQAKWLNKEKNREATAEEKRNIAVPEELEPNYRSFYYVFLEEKHRLVIEARNELGHHFAPSRAERMFQRLFDRYKHDQSIEVAVTVIPEDETLDKILAIPKLRRLEILLKRPNADVEDVQRILRGLERQGARSQKLELVRAAGKKTLTPDKDTKTLAGVAADGNGHVSGEGTNNAGERVSESTKEHPKIRGDEVEGGSSYAKFLSLLRFY